MTSNTTLKAVFFDWAGTIVDHGSRGPTAVLLEIFGRRGLKLSAEEARGPMGMAKREHIATLLRLPRIAEAWHQRFGNAPAEPDVDALYAEFLPLQKSILSDYSQPIAGAVSAIEQLRARGLQIGSTTGYTRDLMEVVIPIAAREGLVIETVVCADDVPRGRPTPFLLYEAALRLTVAPFSRTVVVDDTAVGVEAGRMAGAWTIGLTRTGNGVGLSEQEVGGLTETERQRLCDRAAAPLRAAGAHYVLESVAELLPTIADIEHRLRRGERPDPC